MIFIRHSIFLALLRRKKRMLKTGKFKWFGAFSKSCNLQPIHLTCCFTMKKTIKSLAVFAGAFLLMAGVSFAQSCQGSKASASAGKSCCSSMAAKTSASADKAQAEKPAQAVTAVANKEAVTATSSSHCSGASAASSKSCCAGDAKAASMKRKGSQATTVKVAANATDKK